MNREEQIKQAAKEYLQTKHRNNLPYVFAEDVFEEGVQWADDNPKKSPWISVEDRLPKHEDEYESEIVIARDGDCVFVGFYAYYSDVWKTLETNITLNATHWMPIPKLPNVEPKK